MNDRRSEGDERPRGSGPADAFLAAVRDLAGAMTLPGWLTEEPNVHSRHISNGPVARRIRPSASNR